MTTVHVRRRTCCGLRHVWASENFVTAPPIQTTLEELEGTLRRHFQQPQTPLTDLQPPLLLDGAFIIPCRCSTPVGA